MLPLEPLIPELFNREEPAARSTQPLIRDFEEWVAKPLSPYERFSSLACAAFSYLHSFYDLDSLERSKELFTQAHSGFLLTPLSLLQRLPRELVEEQLFSFLKPKEQSHLIQTNRCLSHYTPRLSNAHLKASQLLRITRVHPTLLHLRLKEVDSYLPLWNRCLELFPHLISLSQKEKFEFRIGDGIEVVRRLPRKCPSDLPILSSHLTYLDLTGCESLCDEELAPMLLSCRKLTDILLCRCFELTDRSLEQLARHCPLLSSAHLAHNRHFSVQGVQQLLQVDPPLDHSKGYRPALGSSRLTYLNLSHCDQVARKIFQLLPLNQSACHLTLHPFPERRSQQPLSPALQSSSLAPESTEPELYPSSHPLTHLDLSGCDCLEDSGLATLAQNYPNLRVLQLAKCRQLSHLSLKAVAQHCCQLTTIDLCRCEELSDEGIEAVAKGCYELRALDLSRCHRISDTSLEALARYCEKLEALNLSYCKRLTDRGVESLAQGARSLTQLKLAACHPLTDQAVSAISQNCHRLTSLDLSHCLQLTDESVTRLAQSSGALRTLKLQGCHLLTDRSVESLALRCGQLTKLYLSGSIHLTDRSIQLLAERCSCLVQLKIAACPQLSDQSLQAIAHSCTQLTLIDLSYCNHLTQGAIAHLQRALPLLKIINYLHSPL